MITVYATDCKLRFSSRAMASLHAASPPSWRLFDVSFGLAEQAALLPSMLVENMLIAGAQSSTRNTRTRKIGCATVASILLLMPSVAAAITMTAAVISINAGVLAVLTHLG